MTKSKKVPTSVGKSARKSSKKASPAKGSVRRQLAVKKLDPTLHVRKRVAGGATGTILGAAVAGPVGALVGGVLGTVVGAAAETVPVQKPNGARSARGSAGIPPRKRRA
jgi:hypothetical protein